MQDVQPRRPRGERVLEGVVHGVHLDLKLPVLELDKVMCSSQPLLNGFVLIVLDLGTNWPLVLGMCFKNVDSHDSDTTLQSSRYRSSRRLKHLSGGQVYEPPTTTTGPCAQSDESVVEDPSMFSNGISGTWSPVDRLPCLQRLNLSHTTASLISVSSGNSVPAARI
eukprot:CAMPEP_0114563038 /NCGR_PEP_ID=MMETSP0114-20121206/12872_1 /TAXON_ID=31324 /ORGANISM="Goniomonas sp, Strain m" /LENGTH=165 /DNA_ID=CAMNT_0001748809 /DNA_START=235 /DNA_END=733 /DNA_ORIENTATION=+